MLRSRCRFGAGSAAHSVAFRRTQCTIDASYFASLPTGPGLPGGLLSRGSLVRSQHGSLDSRGSSTTSPPASLATLAGSSWVAASGGTPCGRVALERFADRRRPSRGGSQTCGSGRASGALDAGALQRGQEDGGGRGPADAERPDVSHVVVFEDVVVRRGGP
jgi:hypothetical protein